MSTFSKADRLLVLTLIVTIIIDIMGLGVVFPILPVLFIGHDSVMAAGATQLTQEIEYGLAMAVWPLGLFFGAPMMGHLSDVIGRKKVIVTCIFMTAVTYGICAVSISLHSVWLYMIGRFISGFFAGNFEIAQAIVADISPPEKKARNMGLITFAGSVGFIIGPLLTSLTTDQTFQQWFGLSAPFWIAMILSFLNVLAIVFLLKESYKHIGQLKLDWFACFESVGFIFKDKRVRFLGVIFLFLQFGWGMYFMPITAVMNTLFGYTSVTLGWFMAFMGVAFATASIVVLPLVQKFLSLRSMLIVCLLGTAVCMGISCLTTVESVQWVVAFLLPLFELLAYTGLLAILSNDVTETEQGTVMGGAGALMSVAYFIGGVITGPLLGVDWFVPMLVGGFVMLLAGVMSFAVPKRSH